MHVKSRDDNMHSVISAIAHKAHSLGSHSHNDDCFMSINIPTMFSAEDGNIGRLCMLVDYYYYLSNRLNHCDGVTTEILRINQHPVNLLRKK